MVDNASGTWVVGLEFGDGNEVAEVFQRLDKDGAAPNVFWDGFTYEFLRDLVYSKTATGQTKILSSLRAALDVGNFDEGESLIAQLDVSSDESQKLHDRYQLAIDVGRQLESERFVELSAQQMYELFEGVEKHWQVEDDRLICRLKARRNSLIFLPFGIERAEVSGSVRWPTRPQSFQILSHTRALRDNVNVAYHPRQYTVQMRRSNAPVVQARFAEEETPFRLILTPQGDQLMPTERVRWEAPVVEHAPSGIGFRVTTTTADGVVSLGSLRIRLLD